MLDFKGPVIFVKGDIDGNCEKLLRACDLWREGKTLKQNERRVALYMTSFLAGEAQFDVGEGKYKSAIFVAYLTFILHQTPDAYRKGAVVLMTDQARQLSVEYFGEELQDHEVPVELAKTDALIQVAWQPNA